MSALFRIAGLIVVAAAVAAAVVIAYAKTTGLDARPTPGPLETGIARSVRSLAIPQTARQRPNPVDASEAAVADGLAHYADHCASCHGSDGSGNTEMGRGLFPKAPDMREAATQELTDGELFHIIENGVRFTGMPAWSTGTQDGETATWQLVHVIRRLPRLTADEVARIDAMTPRSPDAIRQEIAEERFLQGLDPEPGSSPPSPSSTTPLHSGAHP